MLGDGTKVMLTAVMKENIDSVMITFIVKYLKES